MSKRTELTAADLFVLLDREFRRRRPRECSACFVQLPYRIDTMNGDGANWEVAWGEFTHADDDLRGAIATRASNPSGEGTLGRLRRAQREIEKAATAQTLF